MRPLADSPPDWFLPLCVAVCLAVVVQWTLREFRSEPFPTLLLPVGAGVYHVDSEGIRSVRDELVAVTSSGERVDVAYGDVLYDLPDSYHKPIVRDRLGFIAYTHGRDRAINVGPIHVPLPTGLRTASDVAETRSVFRSRFQAAVGVPVDSFLIVRREYLVDAAAGDERLVAQRTWSALSFSRRR